MVSALQVQQDVAQPVPKANSSKLEPAEQSRVQEPANDSVHLPPSFFPCLDSKPVSTGTLQSVEVPVQDIARFNAACRDYDIEPLDVFCTAWALVLRSYLGVDSVCYGLCRFSDLEASPMCVCVPNLEDQKAIFVNLRSSSQTHPTDPSPCGLRPLGPSNQPFNTALLYHRTESRRCRPNVRSSLDQESGQAFHRVCGPLIDGWSLVALRVGCDS